MFIATIKDCTDTITFHQWAFSHKEDAIGMLKDEMNSRLEYENGKKDCWYEDNGYHKEFNNGWKIKDSGSNDEVYYFYNEITLDDSDSYVEFG